MSGLPNTLPNTLTREVKLLDALHAAIVRQLDQKDLAAAKNAFACFAATLRRTLELEADELYPLAERIVAESGFPPTARLKREQRVIRELLDGLENAIDGGHWEGARGDLRELQAALHTHHEEQRLVLFPLVSARS